MAIFDRCLNNKTIQIDDTLTVDCVIETAQKVDGFPTGHTEYVLRFRRGYNKEHTWQVLRRYNDFAQLHNELCISGIDLPLPGKRLFIGTWPWNMRPDFIAERKQALQVYITAVLMNPILASSLPAKRFVDPDSYSQSFHDQAIQNASLCLRIDGTWTLGTTLGPVGWRLRKHYFKVSHKPPEKAGNKLVKSGSQSHQSKNTASNSNECSAPAKVPDASELVLEWLDYGPDKYVDDKELGGILKSLMSLQHPYIEPIVYATHNENGGLVVRRFHSHGTLKDILCMSTNPKNPFLSKYGNPKGRTALTMKQVAIYGHQILEALIFLHTKGYPYGHLHSGNIAIVNECVRLLDIENYILGVPAFYKPFFVQHSKIHSIETVDVYCFGHILFEMSMGYPLQESMVRQINECPETLKNLLESILSKEACRSGLPSLKQLHGHQFFAQHANVSKESDATDEANKPHFKLSLNAKEALNQSVLKWETRLRDEQKSVKNQKRIVRVQELMSSEEEKRKTKQKAKLEHKQSKLRQQSSLQTHSNGRLSLATATSSMEQPPINRSDSVHAVNSSDTAGGGTTPQSSTKAPTLTFLAQDHEKKKKERESLASSVERQSSTPNISSEDHSGEPQHRSALLESICKFNRGSLRKVRSND